MKYSLFTITVLSLLYIFIFYAPAFGDEGFNRDREGYIQNTLVIMERVTEIEEEREEKEGVITKTLFRIELAIECIFAKGRQIWEIGRVSDPEIRLSRLEWPLSGQMYIFKGEVGSPPLGLSIGGRFGTSRFRRQTNTDEDFDYWGIHNSELKYINYQISYQNSESKVDFFDINLYWHLMDWDKREVNQKILFFDKKDLLDNLLVDKLSLDLFVGYQSLKGRYRMIDPTKEVLRIVDDSWWIATGYPADIGLNSFYKIHYRGPRCGFRLKGATGKANMRLNVAFALLRTSGFGWWNLRDLTFWHSGKEGYGIDIGFEVTYPFTPSFLAGLGYKYLYCRQEKFSDTYTYPGYSHVDVDRGRNANFKMYGPSFILRYIW